MTTARRALIAPGAAGCYHCVQRCVRRAFLCGQDRYTGRSFEHRKGWIEQRLRRLGECFAVAIHAYAVMSNHLHVVVQFDPGWQADWTEADVAVRWVRLFSPREDSDAARAGKIERLLQQPERLTLLRQRLADLSWFMKCLAEPVARKANAEDECSGRFWEGRFKAQVLCDERALLAAMAYVDLNPIRAGIATDVMASAHTSLRSRLSEPEPAPTQPLRPVAGHAIPLGLTLRAYVDLVEWTGQQIRPGKRGVLAREAAGVLDRLDARPERWLSRVQGIGSGYWRVVGQLGDLIDAAEKLRQRWVKGIGFARAIESVG